MYRQPSSHDIELPRNRLIIFTDEILDIIVNIRFNSLGKLAVSWFPCMFGYFEYIKVAFKLKGLTFLLELNVAMCI